MVMVESAPERLRRWRMLLGGGAADGTGCALDAADRQRDRALEALYDSDRKAGLGSTQPNVGKWLADIRQCFPQSVVQVLQRDALSRLKLTQMLMEPETLQQVEPNVELVGQLLALGRLIPAKTRDAARKLVRRLVEDIERRLANPLRQAVHGALARGVRNRRPKLKEIDWPRTISANLRHYQAEYRTIVPETLIGQGRKGSALKDVILCVDQSGSMAGSVIYSGILGAVIGSLKAVRTHYVLFDTEIVDLTERLDDPVEVLFGAQLGGGTDIGRALEYCIGLIRRPADTVFVLISDLIEGGVKEKLLRHAHTLASNGCKPVCLLALDDGGKPCYDHDNAQALADLGIPTFACTPQLFPELIAAALGKRDLREWAARNGVG